MVLMKKYQQRKKQFKNQLEQIIIKTENQEIITDLLIKIEKIIISDKEEIIIETEKMAQEITDIIAAGAGASTKLTYHKENRVERVENCKSVDDYINRFDEMIERKRRNII